MIRKKVRSMPSKIRSELENQQRYYGTCIFYDVVHDKCGIYSARPQVCRAFGHHKNLVCFRNPNAAEQAHWSPDDVSIGTLSLDFTWKDFK